MHVFLCGLVLFNACTVGQGFRDSCCTEISDLPTGGAQYTCTYIWQRADLPCSIYVIRELQGHYVPCCLTLITIQSEDMIYDSLLNMNSH